MDLDSQVEIIAEIDTVAGAVAFLRHTSVDLIFSDIELLDGDAFSIYQEIPVSCPIIFTTAYDQFLMNAFETNGIDYLLKPFTKERLRKAWEKFSLLRNHPLEQHALLKSLASVIETGLEKKFPRKRFAAQYQQALYFVELTDICYFEAREGLVVAYDYNGKKHLLTELSLKAIEDQLDPREFFRLNRSEIISKSHIEKVERYKKNSLSVKLKGCPALLSTSQTNTASFRTWLEK